MPGYSPELVRKMRAVLEDAMSAVPCERATAALKAYVAERILQAAASGETSYKGLLAAASKEIHSIATELMRDVANT
jgi:hypothetical protein